MAKQNKWKAVTLDGNVVDSNNWFTGGGVPKANNLLNLTLE